MLGAVAADVAAVVESRPARRDLRHEGIPVGTRPVGRLEGIHRREVGRIGVSDQVEVSRGPHCEPGAVLRAAAPQVGREQELRSSRVHPHQEGLEEAVLAVLAAVPRAREGIDEGKVRREGGAGQVGGAEAVDGDAEPLIVVAAPEIGGVVRARAARVELHDERVEASAPVARKEGIDRGEVGGIGLAGQVGGAQAIHLDRPGELFDVGVTISASSDVGGVDERGAVGCELGRERVVRAVAGRGP